MTIRLQCRFKIGMNHRTVHFEEDRKKSGCSVELDTLLTTYIYDGQAQPEITIMLPPSYDPFGDDIPPEWVKVLVRPDFLIAWLGNKDHLVYVNAEDWLIDKNTGESAFTAALDKRNTRRVELNLSPRNHQGSRYMREWTQRLRDEQIIINQPDVRWGLVDPIGFARAIGAIHLSEITPCTTSS